MLMYCGSALCHTRSLPIAQFPVVNLQGVRLETEMENVNTTKQLIYVADPMCSWCYGFSPVIGSIVDQLHTRLPLTLLMGGLRAGNTRAMTDDDKSTMRGHWQRVAKASGQPFDFAFFDRDGFVYDTEPACRAVVTMRLLNSSIALAYMHAIQRAFYAEGRDTTSAEVLADIAAEVGVDRSAFMHEMGSSEARTATQQDFMTAKQSGISGFPTLFAGPTEEGFAIVTEGYRPLDGLIEALEVWLDQDMTIH